MNNQANIALYIRISKDDDFGNDESFSITNQRLFLTEYAKSITDIESYTLYTYSDDGYTGTNFNRPQVKKLLKDIERGLINCILVKDFSRFARNYQEITDYLTYYFPMKNIRFISVNDRFDSLYNDSTSIDISVRNLMYSYYSQDISEKVKSSIHERMKKGNFIGSKAPYGYLIECDGNMRKLVIDEESAQIVRRIFDMFLLGYTSTEIANIFNEENILTPSQYKTEKGYSKYSVKASSFWRNHNIKRIARNEEYTGKVISAKQQVKTVGGGNTVTVPLENRIITSDCHEAIVTEEVFQQVQRLLKENLGKMNTVQTDRKLFLRKIICSGCGHVMTRLRSDGGKYVCYTKKYTSSTDCIKTFIYEKDIEKTVLQLLNKYLTIARQTFNEKEFVFKSLIAKKSQAKKDLRYQNGLVKRYESQKLKAYEDYIDEVITRVLYDEKRQECERLIALSHEQIQALEIFLQANENVEMPSNPIIEFYMNQKEIAELTKQMADDLIDRIIVHDSNSFDIVWKFNNIF